ncbi:MAG: hypothetical protein DI596_07125 [Azospira oryzae]|nr:MAG: hypothetical protein DI596_07125 [Azospira oryzae]PZP80098.1 MAG: hypothetical protein DI593_07125 [Azospira oryzae]
MKEEVQAAREAVEDIGMRVIAAMPEGPEGEILNFRPQEVLERVIEALREEEPELIYGLAVILGEHEASQA